MRGCVGQDFYSCWEFRVNINDERFPGNGGQNVKGERLKAAFAALRRYSRLEVLEVCVTGDRRTSRSGQECPRSVSVRYGRSTDFLADKNVRAPLVLE